MTVEMTSLAELDFPTPDVNEAWEATPEEVAAFNDWFAAEAVYQTALDSWLSAEEKYEKDRYRELQREYVVLSMLADSQSDRCYCTPGRGMMFSSGFYDNYTHDAWYGSGSSYAVARRHVEDQIHHLKEVIKQQTSERVQQEARRWYQSIF